KYDFFEDIKLFKYDTNNDSFNKYDINTNIKGSGWGKLCFHKKEEKLYIAHNKSIISLDIKTNTSNRLCHPTNVAYYGKYFLFINNCFHMICMHDNHWIGSKNNHQQTIHTLHNTIGADSDGLEELYNGKAIYISSKKCILLIGGGYFGDATYPNLSTEVWLYNLQNQKWIQIDNFSFPRRSFEAVLTSNERYIVLFGGVIYPHYTIGDKCVDDIFVLDMKHDGNWKMKKCNIKCPKKGECIGTRTGGKTDIIVMGFVKECFQLKELVHLRLPPMYIISLIAKYYNSEMIHWIQCGVEKYEHYGIYLK
ncbi:MAG: hypothetical protein GY755_13000, partial [Chloroflexi bacterium]|nr:hypothetical protein [Chloroflexota bacterium]